MPGDTTKQRRVHSSDYRRAGDPTFKGKTMALPTPASLTVNRTTGSEHPNREHPNREHPNREPPIRANRGAAPAHRPRGTTPVAAPVLPSRHRAPTGPALTDSARVGRHVRVPKTAELVAAHLRRQIVRNELVEGDALPPEAVLMEQFGVSRPTLREAFRVLESEALISVRRGAHGGARVHTPNGDVAARYAGLVLEHRGTTLADVHQAMALLEPACVRTLASATDDTRLTQLRTAHHQATVALDADPKTAHSHHGEFHQLLVDLAGNQTVTVLAAMIRHILEQTNRDEAHPLTTPDTPTDAADARDHHQTHAVLLELLDQGDATAAEAHWREHLAPVQPVDDTPLLDLLG